MLKYKNEGKNHMKKIYNILTICLLTFVLPSYAFAYNATEEITCDSGVLQSDSAATFSANWEPVSYNISYNLNNGEFGTNHPTTAIYNTPFTVDNPTRFGYLFNGWNITGMDAVEHTFGSIKNTNTTYTTSETSFMNLRSTSGTVNFAALWGATNATVNLNNNNVTIDTVNAVFDSAMPAVNTSNVALTMPTRTNAVFMGYFDAITNGNKYYNADLTSNRTWDKTGNQTLYAQFEECSCVNNNDNVATCTVTGVNASNQCEYAYTCVEGYINGLQNDVPVTSGTFTGATATASNNVVAGCSSLAYYTITYMDGTEEITGLFPDQYAITNGITLPTATGYTPVTKTGYTFVGWYDNPELTGTPITGWSRGQTGNKIFYAKWTPKTVQLQYVDKDTGDEIDTTPTTCTYDTTFNLPPAPTKTGYIFTGWELVE